MKYSVDTSGLLDGWRHYPPDIFPTLWTRIEDLIASGDAWATDEVLRELKKKEGDKVYQWCVGQDDLFLPLDTKLQKAVSYILNAHPKLVESGGKRSAADPFVIGVARAGKPSCRCRTRSSASARRATDPVALA